MNHTKKFTSFFENSQIGIIFKNFHLVVFNEIKSRLKKVWQLKLIAKRFSFRGIFAVMEFGISTFGEIVPDRVSGHASNSHERMKQLIELAIMADRNGLDVFALGEHHRNDFVSSSPQMILAAASSVTKNIKFSSAVIVLSSSDPVRVFEQFATLDLLSSGRAEIMVGRGSFIESFPLFGYDLKDYDELFTEKLSLLLEINRKEFVTWQGKLRASIDNLGVYPRPFQTKLPVWIAVGGTPESVVRAGNLDLPLTIAILGSDPSRFTTLTELYKSTREKMGYKTPYHLCINEHVYISDDSKKARDEYWPVYGRMMNKIGRERGWSPMNRAQFDFLCEPEGPLMVGTPVEIVEKLIYQYGLFGNTRFLAQIIFGDIPFEKVANSVKLFAKEVAPKVNEHLRKN